MPFTSFPGGLSRGESPLFRPYDGLCKSSPDSSGWDGGVRRYSPKPPLDERTGASNRVGVRQGMADVGRIVASNGLDIDATASIISRMFGGKKPQLTDDELTRIAQLVVASDADLLEQSLTDQTKLDAVYRAFSKAINVLGSSQPRTIAATGATEGIGDIYDPVASGALEALISTISPSTQQKVQEAAQ